MTEELYYSSAYITEFFAEVISCERGKNGFEIILDRTAFFPEQGGQSSDIGVMRATGDSGQEVHISHVSIDKEGVIRHISDKEIAPGTEILGEIDWDHRFSNMQQHTGEHIFSGLVHSKFGFENVGFHLSDAEVTMDYSGVLTAEDIREIETEVNKAIWENIGVRCEFPGKEELADINYRSKKELTGDIRIVTIPGYDVCACCAPHVERTGEIGLLKVISCQNYKGGVRVSILCGGRALGYLQDEHEILSKLSGMLTTSADKVIPSLNKMREENAELKLDLGKAREELIGYEMAGIDPDRKDVFLVKEAGIDSNVMRKTVNALIEKHPGFCGVFVKSGEDRGGEGAEEYRFIVASGSDGKDCKALLEELKKTCNVKGGGSPQMIQGSLHTNSIEEAIQECMR